MIRLLKALLEFIRNAGAPTEGDSDRNGFLSWKAETHAVGIGLYDGLTSKEPTKNEIPDHRDVEAETHYYRGAFVLGTILQAVLASGGVGLGVLYFL